MGIQKQLMTDANDANFIFNLIMDLNNNILVKNKVLILPLFKIAEI